jgi:signal transduction histidine kinase
MRARQARVLIRDEGPGIPLQEQPHLWERFHRVAGVQARPGTGESLGFGLYIGQEIIKAHKGVIGVESVAGRGSTFWFTLPLLTP